MQQPLTASDCRTPTSNELHHPVECAAAVQRSGHDRAHGEHDDNEGRNGDGDTDRGKGGRESSHDRSLAEHDGGERGHGDRGARHREGTPTEAHAVANRGAHVGATVRLTIADDTADRRPPSKLDVTILRTQAKAALVGLGWKGPIAQAAVAAAAASQGPEATLESLILESLRRCPKPRT
jgi:hypothetical protein